MQSSIDQNQGPQFRHGRHRGHGHHNHRHHHDHDDRDHNRKRSIRYFRLHNSGAAIIHFLIRDSTDGNTLFDGGPTLTSGSFGTIDLAKTEGLADQDGARLHFGAGIAEGRGMTDHRTNEIDFDSRWIGVWKWTGATVADSKIKFEGYEKFCGDHYVLTCACAEEGVKGVAELNEALAEVAEMAEDGLLDKKAIGKIEATVQNAIEAVDRISKDAEERQVKRVGRSRL